MLKSNLTLVSPVTSWIDVASKAAGLTQSEFIERCVTHNTDEVVEMSDEDRKKIRIQLKQLQESVRQKLFLDSRTIEQKTAIELTGEFSSNEIAIDEQIRRKKRAKQ